MSTIGDKVMHVRAAQQTRLHHCHWPGCPQQVPPAKWGCKPHWYALPHAIRDRIWRAYQIGQEQTMRPSDEYIAAAEEAQTWIRATLNNPRRPGLGELASRLQREHPSWSSDRCIAEAKVRITERQS
jgi:hypothetical protein